MQPALLLLQRVPPEAARKGFPGEVWLWQAAFPCALCFQDRRTPGAGSCAGQGTPALAFGLRVEAWRCKPRLTSPEPSERETLALAGILVNGWVGAERSPLVVCHSRLSLPGSVSCPFIC